MAETEEEKALTEQVAQNLPEVSGFGGAESFDLIQRQAKLLSASDLVPKEFKGKIANCVIALEMAQRVQASPMAVMQNLYIVHGKPSWSSQFIIAAINNTGRYSPLRFKIEGTGKDMSCAAWAIEKASGERLEGPAVTMQMADAEGWINKSGSKWKTMPELMMRYRAGTFFGRLYAPEILMGMQSTDEIHDIIDITPTGGAQDLMDRFSKGGLSAIAEESDEALPAGEPKQETTRRSGRKAATKIATPKEKLSEALGTYCDSDMLMMQDVLKEVSYQEKDGAPQWIENIDEASKEDIERAYNQLQNRIEAES